MLNKPEFVSEGFSTLTTFVRPGSSVNSVVLNEVVALAEGSPTFVAFIRPCSRVRSLAITNGGALVKWFLTYITIIMTLRVKLRMLKESVFVAEWFPIVTVHVMTPPAVKGLLIPTLEIAG